MATIVVAFAASSYVVIADCYVTFFQLDHTMFSATNTLEAQLAESSHVYRMKDASDFLGSIVVRASGECR